MPLPPHGAPVRTTSLAADVQVVDGVATTSLKQVVRNDGRRPAEAIWLLPLPAGAAADEFRMTVDGVEMSGEVLGAEGARGVYESIVRRRLDPGLLEYYGRGCLRARIFPIPPQGQVEVEVGFRHVLPELAGLHRWTFALNQAGVGGRPPEYVTLDLSIRSRKTLRNAFAPASSIQVIRQDDHRARASFEGPVSLLPAGELSVFYGLSEREFGLNFLSHKRSGEREGTFMMLISPRRDFDEERVLSKTITFVLDTSGSMAGAKIDQARGALRFFIGSLREGDRFNVVPFATEAEPFFPAPVEATASLAEAALERIEGLEAGGGTNIASALRAGLPRGAADAEGLQILVFLTDGLPTVGVKDPKVILAEAQRLNAGRTRVFVFGVGDDVNTHLLDTLAADGGGSRCYVRQYESIEEKTSDLLTRLSHPVLTDLRLEADGVRLVKVVPARLPDLFKGSRLTVFGRYEGEGPCAIRLSGAVEGARREYVYEGTFAAGPREDFDFVPRLWAERRVGMLLDAIRLNGKDPELLDEVGRLGREYRIVTPYTSHLIVEEGLAVPGERPRRRASGHGGAYRGPGDAVPPGGGGGGGAGPITGPSSPGPAGPGSLGPATPGAPPSLDEIAASLRDAGVLPRDASPAELRELAETIAVEMRAGEGALGGLGRRTTGKGAVDDSAYLAGLIAAGTTGGEDEFFLGKGRRRMRQAALIDLFTRKIKDKVFLLRWGVWVDRDLTEELAKGKTVVEAYSKEYFDLLKARPELAPYLAFSPRMIVVMGEEAFEVTPPRATEEEPPAGGEGH